MLLRSSVEMAEEPEDLLATTDVKPLKSNTSDIITAK
jgi:hypothetical protein